MQNSNRQLIYTILTLFASLQFIVLFIFGYTPYPDSEGYLLLAKDCLSYGESYPVKALIYDYAFLWNIGAINTAEWSLYLFKSIVPLLIVYSLMKGISAWLFYEITKCIFSSKIALIALVIYVIYPANYGEGTSLLSELPFMFFILLGFYFIIVKKWMIAGGMLLALANWFRPMGIVFLLAIVIYIFIYQLFKWRNSIKIMIGYATIICCIGLMSVRHTGLFLYQAKTGWMALMDYSTDNSLESLQVRDNNKWNVAQKDSAWRSMFFKWLTDHPKEYVAQMPDKLINTYVSDNVNMCTFIPNKTKSEYMYSKVSLNTLIETFPNYSFVQWLTILNLAIYYSILLCALASLLYFRMDSHLLPISCIILGTLLLLFVGHGEARFHIIFMPFFMMLSADFILQKYGKNRMD